MRKTILLFLISIYSISSFAQCTTPLPAQFSIGANLNGLSDYDQDRPFNDVFKTNRGMSTDTNAPWNYIAPAMDTDGWPLQDFAVIVMVNMDSTMAGTYSIRFNGSATISPIASPFVVQNQVYDSVTNTTTADLVHPSSGNQMMIKFTNTYFSPGVTGIKNISIMKPGLSFNAPAFSQQFLDHLQRFNTIRFMDWHDTNANNDSLWQDRALRNATSQCGPVNNNRGIAWEYCIELANTLNKNIWINIPHKADDNYVLQLATLIHDSLNPNLKVYVEYSNEVWNWSFQQAQWNRQQAIIEGNNGGVINYDNINDTATWHYRRIANRGKQISDIFSSVYGAGELGNRFRPVYAVQVSYFDVGQRGIEFIHNYYGSPKNYFYALAGAPYFSSSPIDTSNTATSAQVLQALQNSVDTEFYGYDNSIAQYAALSNYYGLKFICYEGGPDTFGPNNIQAKKSATEDPQMKTICMNYLNNWFDYGADGLFMWFTAGAGNWDSQYGTWSLTQHYENSQKLQAIDSILQSPVASPSNGFILPGTIDARKYEGHSSGWNSNPDFTAPWNPYVQYLLNIPQGQAGNYLLQTETQCNSSGKSFTISVDEIFTDSVNVINNGASGYVYDTLGLVFLKEGLHTLRFTKNNNSNGVHILNYHFVLDSLCDYTAIIKEPADESHFNIFPNPTENFAYWNTDPEFGKEYKVILYSSIGQKLIEKENCNYFDLAGYPSQLYFVVVINKKGNAMKGKILKR